VARISVPLRLLPVGIYLGQGREAFVDETFHCCIGVVIVVAVVVVVVGVVVVIVVVCVLVVGVVVLKLLFDYV
jgi:hypothetical protein